MSKRIVTAALAAFGLSMASTAMAALDDAGAAELMKKSGCAVCHTVEKKLLGPAYKDVAAKRKADGTTADTIAKTVRAGSKGVYGPIPMPANPDTKISDADLKSLVAWILTK